MIRRKIVLALTLAVFTAVAVQAQTATPQVSKRQAKQTTRIKQGVKSGELTGAETATLAKQQRQIKRSKRRAKADGEVTKAERTRLHARQNQANRQIRRKKNNDRDRN
jgi:hypothetical protein